MTSKRSPKGPVNSVVLTPFHDEMEGLALAAATAPASAAWGTSNLAHFYPTYLADEFEVSKVLWCNGATVGTDLIDVALYRLSDPATGRMDLIRAIGGVPSAFTASVVQESGMPHVTCLNVMSGNSSTDAATYATVAVQLAIGKLYVLAVENSHGTSATAVSSIDGGPTFTSRSTVQYNGTLNRVSIWTCVPAANYNGTLTINFGATTQTGCVWSLEEFSGVDTAVNDGMVQQATGTGTSVTPQVTLAAFASAYNATYAALANIADTTTTPKTGFIELTDTSAATPLQCLETEWRVANDTTPNGTITSAAWGGCAIEIKAATRPASPWRIARVLLTSGNDSTDRSNTPGYTTASVTLKKGRLYLMSVENSHASSAAAVNAITGGGTWTSRSTTQYNSSLNRVSVWSCVPTADVVGTIDIAFSAAQTGCVWSLLELVGVDTTTNDGVVQQVAATGNTTTPIVSLAAFGSISNACFFVEGNVASAATPGRGLTEMSDDTAATPAQYMETAWRVDSSTYPFATITSAQWGACAIELACDTSTVFIPNSEPETPNIYMAFVVNGTTATLLSTSQALSNLRSAGILTQASSFPLPSSLLVTGVAPTRVPLAGFSGRSLIG
jgi:hypothetical protein